MMLTCPHTLRDVTWRGSGILREVVLNGELVIKGSVILAVRKSDVCCFWK
jgi:hypothetical protein